MDFETKPTSRHDIRTLRKGRSLMGGRGTFAAGKNVEYAYETVGMIKE